MGEVWERACGAEQHGCALFLSPTDAQVKADVVLARIDEHGARDASEDARGDAEGLCGAARVEELVPDGRCDRVAKGWLGRRHVHVDDEGVPAPSDGGDARDAAAALAPEHHHSRVGREAVSERLGSLLDEARVLGGRTHERDVRRDLEGVRGRAREEGRTRTP